MAKQGTLSIHSQNIFPIIKKWLYSDHDIFVRELISNASDAILKFKKLCDMGEATDSLQTPFEITVTLDKENKKLIISDNGIGLDEEEIEKYITQIAFSGAEDFLEKYKDKMDQDQIIGHFGLGFYSSFMVADTVEIDSLSYHSDHPVHWSCDGGTTYTLSEGTRQTRGTDIILHIGEEYASFLEYYTLSQIIEKYCSFMPVPIFIKDASKKDEIDSEKESEDKQTPINDTHPLYVRKPSECDDEAYKTFYQKTFSDFNEPLFWIHLNMDYPFRLKGILYFPKLKHEFEVAEGKIKLYNNQVFVADNIKEVIPEFLLLLKGVIDCPDLPLNVSRSFLQNDGFVQKISDYITKKVADKLISLSKKETESYHKFWNDIAPFIKYGCLKDDKFFKKMKEHILFQTTQDEYVTLSNYLEHVKEQHENKMFYISDASAQSQYIRLFKENHLLAVYLQHPIDAPFISHLEASTEHLQCLRIDSDLAEVLKGEAADETLATHLTDLFKSILKKDTLKIKLENLKNSSMPAMILISEQGRRMQEMMKMYGMDTDHLPENESTLVLNQNHPLIQSLNADTTSDESKKLICQHLYDMALLSNQTLSADALTEFLERNSELLLKVTENK